MRRRAPRAGSGGRSLVTALVLVLAWAQAGCAADVPAPVDGADLTGAASSQAGQALPLREAPLGAVVPLTGAAVIPGPGDGDASGEAVVALVEDRNELCVEITVRGLDQLTSAHLHDAEAGQTGDVVLALPAPQGGTTTLDACVSARPDVLERLRASPERFYLSVHSTSFPDGALRGQLR